MNDTFGDVDDISQAELSAFSGSVEIARGWRSYLAGESKTAGFNVYAAVFGSAWFFYRKLHREGCLAFLADVAVPTIGLAAAVILLGESNGVAMGVAWGFSLVLVRVVLGYWSNMVWCDKAAQEIRAVDQMNCDNEMHLQYIRAAGGVSFGAFLICWILIGLSQRILVEFF